jgi:hypothetical protein
VTPYSVATGAVGVHSKTLAAGIEDVVTFAGDPDTVEVLSNGAADLYVSTDGAAATVAGANTYVLPAGGPCARAIPSFSNSPVRLISAGTPTYSVTRM